MQFALKNQLFPLLAALVERVGIAKNIVKSGVNFRELQESSSICVDGDAVTLDAFLTLTLASRSPWKLA